MKLLKMMRFSVLVVAFLSSVMAVLCTDSYTTKDFPPGFVFGVSTTAYQVEGAADEDGRSPSVWDTFCHEGRAGGATGDIAANGYHKYEEDVQLLVNLGVNAYRFSISWSRLIPNGTGFVNPKGVQFYNNLINELVSHGIEPHVLLVNYDHPQTLEDRYTGWLNRQIVKDFTNYADVCFREFGDRVSHWTTINEPNVFTLGGYDQGMTPPCRCSAPFGANCAKGDSTIEPYLATHNILLAHASAVKLYREKYQAKQRGHIGINIFSFDILPLTSSKEDLAAAQRAKDFIIGWILDPLTFGDYPDVMKENVGSRLPAFTSEESELVKGSFDFLGLVHYSSEHVKDNPSSLESKYRDFTADMAAQQISYVFNFTTFEFPIMPSTLQDVLEYVKESYNNPPIYIYENGQRTQRNSSLEDVSRTNYLQAYIGGVLDSIRNGTDARGYFVWSFIDVLELLDGYNSSFGLYYVDLDDPDLKRQPKLSSYWYSGFLKGGIVGLDGVIEHSESLSAVHQEASFQ